MERAAGPGSEGRTAHTGELGAVCHRVHEPPGLGQAFCTVRASVWIHSSCQVLTCKEVDFLCPGVEPGLGLCCLLLKAGVGQLVQAGLELAGVVEDNLEGLILGWHFLRTGQACTTTPTLLWYWESHPGLRACEASILSFILT